MMLYKSVYEEQYDSEPVKMHTSVVGILVRHAEFH